MGRSPMKRLATQSMALALALTAATSATALDLTSGTFYVGGGIGASWMDPDTDGTIFSVSDDNDFAWNVLGGYRINQNFAVELAYTDLGKAGLEVAADGSSAGEIKYRQTTLGVLWSPTMKPDLTWRPYLKGGVNYADHSWDEGTLDTEEWNAFGGLGIEKDLGSYGLSLRADYTYYSQDAQALNFSLVKYFND